MKTKILTVVGVAVLSFSGQIFTMVGGPCTATPCHLMYKTQAEIDKCQEAREVECANWKKQFGGSSVGRNSFGRVRRSGPALDTNFHPPAY